MQRLISSSDFLMTYICILYINPFVFAHVTPGFGAIVFKHFWFTCHSQYRRDYQQGVDATQTILNCLGSMLAYLYQIFMWNLGGVARFYDHYIGSAITKKYAVYEALGFGALPSQHDRNLEVLYRSGHLAEVKGRHADVCDIPTSNHQKSRYHAKTLFFATYRYV